MNDADTAASAEEGGPSRPAGNGLTRMTVNLTPKSMDALDELTDSTGYSKTDIINRGVQIYKILSGFMGKDGGLVIKPADAETEVRLHIL